MAHVEIPFILEEGQLETTSALEADDGEYFRETAWRALGAIDEAEIQHPLFVRVISEEFGDDIYSAYVEIPADLTIRGFLQITDGDEYRISHGGWGGDVLWAEPIINGWDLLGAGMTLSGAYFWAKSKGLDLVQLRFRRQHELATNWRDGDDQENVPIELRQMVKEVNPWYRSQFDFRFRLDASAGTALLKACGYRKVSTAPEDVWRDESEPDNSRFF